jgi:hypothetical protein
MPSIGIEHGSRRDMAVPKNVESEFVEESAANEANQEPSDAADDRP